MDLLINSNIVSRMFEEKDIKLLTIKLKPLIPSLKKLRLECVNIVQKMNGSVSS